MTVLRILVTGGPPVRGGGGIPTASASSRSQPPSCGSGGLDSQGIRPSHGPQIANVAIDHAEEGEDGGSVGGDAVEVAHELCLFAHCQHDFTSVGRDYVSVGRIVPNALQFHQVIY